MWQEEFSNNLKIYRYVIYIKPQIIAVKTCQLEEIKKKVVLINCTNFRWNNFHPSLGCHRMTFKLITNLTERIKKCHTWIFYVPSTCLEVTQTFDKRRSFNLLSLLSHCAWSKNFKENLLKGFLPRCWR